MNIPLQYLLLSLPLIVHLIVDLKGKVNHKLNALYVLAISLAVGFVLHGYWFQGTLYALCIHFTFFDPLYNLTHGHKLFYHGDARNPDRAWTDKFWSNQLYFMEVLIRIFVLALGWFVYYELDRIIGA